jgi:hypothetical protein
MEKLTVRHNLATDAVFCDGWQRYYGIHRFLGKLRSAGWRVVDAALDHPMTQTTGDTYVMYTLERDVDVFDNTNASALAMILDSTNTEST